MRLIYKFLKDENAATAIEYGLIAAGISATRTDVTRSHFQRGENGSAGATSVMRNCTRSSP